MISEAIETLYELLRTAAEISAKQLNDEKKYIKLDIPNDTRNAHYSLNGELVTFPVPPKLRSHTVGSLKDLIAAAGNWEKNPVVWVSSDSVVLIIDDDDRRERVTLPLVKTAIWKQVEFVAARGKFEQRDLVTMLRGIFRDATQAEQCLLAIRAIKFQKVEEGHSVVGNTKESLGRAINQEVVGLEGNIPDCFIVGCRVFTPNCDVDQEIMQDWAVTIDLSINVDDQAFILKPYPDQVEQVLAEALSQIRDEIKSELDGVPVFFGTP